MDGSQKEGGNFLNLLQKEGGTQKGGFPQKRGGSNPRGNYVLPLPNSAELNENIRSNYSKGNPDLIIDISAQHFKVFNMMSNYFLLNSPV